MTVTELARLLATLIRQGRGEHQVALYQWEHGWQQLTEVLPRDGAEVVELYSDTVKGEPYTPSPRTKCKICREPQVGTPYGLSCINWHIDGKPELPDDEDDDLLGIPAADEPDDLDDLI